MCLLLLLAPLAISCFHREQVVSEILPAFIPDVPLFQASNSTLVLSKIAFSQPSESNCILSTSSRIDLSSCELTVPSSASTFFSGDGSLILVDLALKLPEFRTAPIISGFRYSRLEIRDTKLDGISTSEQFPLTSGSWSLQRTEGCFLSNITTAPSFHLLDQHTTLLVEDSIAQSSVFARCDNALTHIISGVSRTTVHSFTASNSSFLSCVTPHPAPMTLHTPSNVFTEDTLCGMPAQVSVNGDISYSNCVQTTRAYLQADSPPVTFTFTACTFANCTSPNGAGGSLFINATSMDTVTLTSCILSNSTAAGKGGALFVSSAKATTIEQTNFTSCTSSSSGGALSVHFVAQLALNTVLFTGCTAPSDFGGAIFIGAESSAVISTSSFTSCTSQKGGGALYVSTDSSTSMTETSFADCSAQTGGACYFLKAASGTKMDNCHLLRCSADSTDGGGVVFCAGTAELDEAVFEQCTSERNGGALSLVDNALVTIHSCHFTSCSTIHHGGAISADVETLTCSSSSFKDCQCHYSGSLGGAIYADTELSCTLVNITSCSFEGCKSYGSGGGIGLPPQSRMSLQDCTFRRCESLTEHGGAIYVSETSEPSITNCSFASCIAHSFGGAICVANGCNVTVTSCSLLSCQSEGCGGGLYFFSPTVTASHVRFIQCASYNGGGLYQNDVTDASRIDQSTFICCNASHHGGAIYLCNGSALTMEQSTFTNLILYWNSARVGQDVSIYQHVTSNAETVTNYFHRDSCFLYPRYHAPPSVSIILMNIATMTVDLGVNYPSDWFSPPPYYQVDSTVRTPTCDGRRCPSIYSAVSAAYSSDPTQPYQIKILSTQKETAVTTINNMFVDINGTEAQPIVSMASTSYFILDNGTRTSVSQLRLQLNYTFKTPLFTVADSSYLDINEIVLFSAVPQNSILFLVESGSVEFEDSELVNITLQSSPLISISSQTSTNYVSFDNTRVENISRSTGGGSIFEESTAVKIGGFTCIGCRSTFEDGGAVALAVSNGSDAELFDASFTSCRAANGGAVSVTQTGGTLTIRNVVFSNCSVYDSVNGCGGAFFISRTGGAIRMAGVTYQRANPCNGSFLFYAAGDADGDIDPSLATVLLANQKQTSYYDFMYMNYSTSGGKRSSLWDVYQSESINTTVTTSDYLHQIVDEIIANAAITGNLITISGALSTLPGQDPLFLTKDVTFASDAASQGSFNYTTDSAGLTLVVGNSTVGPVSVRVENLYCSAINTTAESPLFYALLRIEPSLSAQSTLSLTNCSYISVGDRVQYMSNSFVEALSGILTIDNCVFSSFELVTNVSFISASTRQGGFAIKSSTSFSRITSPHPGSVLFLDLSVNGYFALSHASFTDCRTTSHRGGALCISTTDDASLSITGAAFTNCSAKEDSFNSYGGAVFLIIHGPPKAFLFHDLSFQGCTATLGTNMYIVANKGEDTVAKPDDLVFNSSLYKGLPYQHSKENEFVLALVTMPTPDILDATEPRQLYSLYPSAHSGIGLWWIAIGVVIALVVLVLVLLIYKICKYPGSLLERAYNFTETDHTLIGRLTCHLIQRFFFWRQGYGAINS